MTTATEAGEQAAMRAALALARHAQGTTVPNPPVGCVLLGEDGAVVGRGRTGRGGRPHAEIKALEQAGRRARQGSAFVTLEPCAHEDTSPSCARALTEAGIARAFIATHDPDPRTAGKGIKTLRGAGVAVEEGFLADEAWPLNAGHVLRIQEERPFVTLKIASSLDGRIATRTGESRWITGEAARHHVHLLRARADVVLVGAATARIDNPLLTCRLPGLEDDSPVRAVLAGSNAVDLESALIRSANDVPLWILIPAGVDTETYQNAEKKGAKLVKVPAGKDGRASLRGTLKVLALRGIGGLLVEGGGRLAASFLSAGLVDRIVWYQAGMAIGAEGVPALGVLPPAPLPENPRFQYEGTHSLGEDVVHLLARATPSAAAKT